MIYTCTMAPSLDYTAYVHDFTTSTLNRSDYVDYQPGGKGINVSQLLHRFGCRNTALGFIGAFTGRHIEETLQKNGVHTAFIPIHETTRINVKIKTGKETELNGPAPWITDEAVQQLLAQLKNMKPGDWFILAGSIPPAISEDVYQQIADICHQQGIYFVVDTSGEALKPFSRQSPFLIKPNQDELSALFETTITTTAQAIFYAEKLLDWGVGHIIVSLGDKGAVFVSEHETLEIPSPSGTPVNTVGAGDSMIAGFIASYLQYADIRRAFKYSVACGSATAFQQHLCQPDDVEALYQQLTLKERTR